MADYWKSNERKYCDFCNCWISDNKASNSFHENGKRHKMNVAKRISDISRNSEQAERERKKMDAEIRKMEEAAMRSYAKDISAGADMTATSISAVMSAQHKFKKTGGGGGGGAAAAGSSRTTHTRQIDPMRLPGSDDDDDDGNEGSKSKRVTVQKVVEPETVPNASLWVEGKSDEGYTYYWNVKTNESVWEAPKEGYLSYDEYQRVNELAMKQQEMAQATEAKKFRENVNEEVARFNRERLKMFRKPETAEEKEAKRVECERRAAFKTEQEAATSEIGAWQVVETKPAPEPIDWELPQRNDDYYVPPVVSDIPVEPPVKRFKEKTIESLDPEFGCGTSGTFKKRKFAAKGNQRKRLDDD